MEDVNRSVDNEHNVPGDMTDDEKRLMVALPTLCVLLLALFGSIVYGLWCRKKDSEEMTSENMILTESGIITTDEDDELLETEAQCLTTLRRERRISEQRDIEEDVRRRSDILFRKQAEEQEIKLEEERLISEREEKTLREKQETGVLQKQLDTVPSLMEHLQTTTASKIRRDEAEKAALDVLKSKTTVLEKKLQIAIKKKSITAIIEAVQDYQQFTNKLGSDNAEIPFDAELIETAKKSVEALRIRSTLLAAIDEKDGEKLKTAIKKAEESNVADLMKLEVTRAINEVVKIERIHKLRNVILSMGQATMEEIRHYKEPPFIVHDVMVAALLLLGDHEGITRKWPACQILLNNSRSPDYSGIVTRIKEFKPCTVNPGIAARVKIILNNFTEYEVSRVSPGAGCFFVWANGMAEEVLTPCNGTNPIPANIKRQKEIFGT